MPRYNTIPVFILTLFIGATSVRAEDPVVESRAAFNKGRAEAKRGDQFKKSGQTIDAQDAYEIAAAHFVRAYELNPTPIILYSLGEVYRVRGNTQWAKSCYQRFIELAESADRTTRAGRAAIQRVPEAQRRIVAIETASNNVEIPEETLPPFGVCLDAPTSQDVALADGADRATVTDPPLTHTDVPVASRTGYRLGFFATVGIAVAAFTVSGIAHWQVTGSIKQQQLDAIAAYQNFSEQPLAAVDACTDAENERRSTISEQGIRLLDGVIATCDRGESKALLANITRGVGALALGAAAYLLYRGYLRRAPAATTAFAPTITADTVGAHLTFTF